MISSVFVSGRLGEKKPPFRYVEVDRLVPSDDGKFLVDRFLVRSCFGADTPFMKLPSGSYVCFKGRLESDERHGLVIVDEMDEVYGTERPF